MMQGGWRSLARMLGVATVAVLAAGCASGGSGGMTPSASVTTVMQGWERYFALDWAVSPKANGNQIDGYLYNQYGAAAANVQILAQGLDEKGNVIAQKLEWVPGMVPPLSRAFFRVPGLPPAPQYRVAVWAFDWVQGVGDDRR
jgi:hypothetical protein